MNPAYDRARQGSQVAGKASLGEIDRARMAEEGGVGSEEIPEPEERPVRDENSDESFWDDPPSGGTQQQDSNARWVTINGRHVLVQEAQAQQQISESSAVNRLTVGDIAGILYNETASLGNSGKQNDSIDAARTNVAGAIINADIEYGDRRDRIAGTAPSTVSKADMRTEAYKSSLAAAKAAYADWKAGKVLAGGATHFNLRPNPSTGNFRPNGTMASGFPLKTQSGPYNNSYPTPALPARSIYVNTYE